MRRVILIATAVLLIGCASLSPVQNFEAINSSVAALKTDLASAMRAIAGVRPHVTGADAANLDQALASIKSAGKHADGISPANEKWQADFAVEKGNYDKLYNSAWCKLGRVLSGSLVAAAVSRLCRCSRSCSRSPPRRLRQLGQRTRNRPIPSENPN
jgi:hypothetical protein